MNILRPDAREIALAYCRSLGCKAMDRRAGCGYIEAGTDAGIAGIGIDGRNERRNVEKLTDEQVKRLPDWVQVFYNELSKPKIRRSRVATLQVELRLIHELARALTPQPCGHPGACVVSVPYIGENKSNSCGWCETEAERDFFKRTAKLWRRMAFKNGRLGRELIAERDALRNNLAALEGEKGVLDALLSAALAGLKVAGANDDALREKLKAAEGLAEALDFVEWEPSIDGLRDACPWCHRLMKRGHKDDCQRETRLAAWKAANDDVS